VRAWSVLVLAVVGCASETTLSKSDDGEDAPSPVMTVAPLELGFGVVVPGDDALRTFTITNDGDADLDVSGVAIDGGAYALFDPLFPATLVPGEVVEVDVVFAPLGGLTDGTATVTGSDPITPSTDVRLLGELGLPQLEIDPPAVDFGSVPLLCEEQTSVQLVSTGNVPVTVDRALVSGDGFAIVSSPEFPVVLVPGDRVAIELSVVPDQEGVLDGALVVGSDDLAGDDIAPLSAFGLQDGECIPPADAELVFDVQYERADVAIILDTSSSMGATTSALASQFASISSALSALIPDLTWGVGTFDDYNNVGYAGDRPFRLEQQQTDDLSLAGGVLSSISLAVGGVDWEEASSEALLQAAQGYGYDQNCNFAFDGATDVQPFRAQPLDAFRGFAAGSYDPGVPGTGDQGGMGFREGVFPIFILATDATMKEGGVHATPGGCPGDATVVDVIYAINELGGSFIGVEVVGWGASPVDQMEAIAIGTGSFGDLDGDGIDEPTVTRWSGSEVEFRDTIVRAVEALAGAAVFDKVELETVFDPAGVVLGIAPDAYYDVVAGTEVTFDLTLDGEMLLVPDPAASEARFHLIADDTLVLAERSIWVR
jgi:hypothetical protein